MLDFVDQLVERRRRRPAARARHRAPELLQRRPGWGGGKPNALTISLSPLSDDETRRLVSRCSSEPQVDARSAGRALARAGGNPLYAEQYARKPRSSAARSSRCRRPCRESSPLGSTRFPRRRSGCCRTRRWSARSSGWARSRRSTGSRAGRPRSCSMRSRARSSYRRSHLVGRNRERVRVPSRAHPRRRLRPDPACGAIAEASASGAWIESLGRPEEQAEMLAHHYLQALELAEAAGSGRSCAGRAGPECAARRRRPGRGALRVRGGGALLRRRASAVAGGRSGAGPAPLPPGRAPRRERRRRSRAARRGQGCPARRRRQGEGRRGGDAHLDQASGCRAGASPPPSMPSARRR